MAERSLEGWDTVKEYLSDDLASDSADEKRIRSAESRAAARKDRRPKKPYDRSSATITKPQHDPMGVGPTSRSSGVFPRFRSTDPPGTPYRTYRGYGEQYSSDHRGSRISERPRLERPRSDQHCYQCGKKGHYRHQCSKRYQHR